jgi:isocitrate lyase
MAFLSVEQLKKDWAENPRWKGINAATPPKMSCGCAATYRSSTAWRNGAPKTVEPDHHQPYVNCLGALTGGQAMQQAKAGVKAIYLSGWQVAADNNTYMSMYPDQSLYPVNSVPAVVERINNTFKRADEIQCARGIGPGHKDFVDYFLPIVGDAEAGLAAC